MQEPSPDQFVQFQRTAFRRMGIWPTSEQNRDRSCTKSLVIFVIVSYATLVSITVEIWLSISDMEKIIDASYYFLTHLPFVMKMTIFWLRRESFKSVLRHLEDPTFGGHVRSSGPIARKWLTIARFFTKFFYYSCILCLVIYVAYPLIDNDERVLLPFRAWLPFDVKTNVVNRVVAYFWQVCSLMIGIVINCNIDTISTSLMNFGCAQIEILQKNLQSTHVRLQNDRISGEQCRGVHKSLVDCIEHHKLIIRYIKNVEETFGAGIFLQFIFCAISFCITGFQLTISPTMNIKYVSIISYFLAVIIQFTTYCWNGDQIITQSSRISGACYGMEWYSCSPGVKRSILIIMENTREPIKIRVGKYFTLSVETLAVIFQSSYTYFTVLKNLYSK